MSQPLLPPEPARLRPPQFRLSTLMLVTALVASLFGLYGVIGPYAMFGLALIGLTVVAHVAGNAIGTRLRDLGGTPEADVPGDEVLGELGAARPLRYAPRTRLSRHDALGAPMFVSIGVGVLGGAGLALFWVWRSMPELASLENLSVALAAGAILGGIWIFLAVGFLQVALGALFHASRYDSTRRRRAARDSS